MKSKFIVLAGPSGSGKTTIMQELVKQHPEIKYARSMTTRPYRDKSDDNMYCFISEENFLKKKKTGKFFETSQYAGHWYGTPKFEYERAVKGGYHIIKALDIDGALTVKKALDRHCILFYVCRRKEYVVKALVERAVANPALVNDVTNRIIDNLSSDCPNPTLLRCADHIVHNDGTVEAAAKSVADHISFSINSEKYDF